MSHHDLGGLGYEPGPVGPPPDIFQQDYAQQDYAQQDYAQQDYGRRDRAGSEYGGETYRQDGYGSPGPAGQDHAWQDYPPQDYPPQDYPWSRDGVWSRDDAQPNAVRDYSPADRAMDRSMDHAAMDHAAMDRAGTDFADREQGFRNGGGHVADPDYAARMDPALQDFFDPQGSRPGMAQPGPGQRYGTRGYAAQTSRGPAELGQPGRLNDRAQANRRDAMTMAPGGRAMNSRPSRRRTHLGVAVGVVLGVAALAVAGIEFMSGGKTNSPTKPNGANAISTANSAPTTGASPKASTASQPAAKQTGYLLATPATAGGYPRLGSIPTAVQSAASTTAQTVRGSVVSGGGKVTSQVSAGYQLSGGQVMSFTGYEGTFTPAKVVASLGANAQTYAAGKDGGSLACFTASGAKPGTVCVWATTTTIGVTEFFSSAGPEVVTVQSKAASDTVNVRNNVEHRE